MKEIEFRKILQEAMNEEYKWVPEPNTLKYEYDFSKSFERRINKAINACDSKNEITDENNYIWIRRHAFKKTMVAVLVAVLALAFVACATYWSIRWNETENIKQGTLDIEFDISDSHGEADSFEYKRPKTPSGFTVITEIKDSDMFELKYENGENLGIDYFQDSGLESMGLSINNESDSFSEIKVNGYKGYAIKEAVAPYIVWSDGEYLFYISGNVSYDILLEMAESVE